MMFINNDWKFYLGECEDAYYRGYNDKGWNTVDLPHDWSVEHDFDINHSSGTGYLPGGNGWYRKHFDYPQIEDGKRLFINFGGVYNNSRVWCNSNYLGKRPYGYSSFMYEITEFIKKKDNVISVNVNHPQTADSRWFTGSGIYRDVTLIETGRFSISNYDSIFIHTDCNDNEAQITVEFKIDGGEAKIKLTLSDKSGNCVSQTEATAQSGKVTLNVEKPELWSDENPYLYTLTATVYDNDTVSDERTIPVGIRTLVFDCNNGLFVNGKSVKLKGVCVHHDSGALGAAFYKPVWKRRLETLKKCGCNAIRTSHNPPDPLLLDLCDEMGFYVMDEAFDEWEGCKNKWWHGHNVYPPKHYGYSEDFPEWHEKDLADMVLRDRNHPSVIMWSIGNEIDYPNDPYGYFAFDTVTGNNDAHKPLRERRFSEDRPDAKRLTTVARELVAIVKKHDTTRPVTSALSFPEMCEYIGITDELDIAGYNYKEKFYAPHREAHPNRFVYGSENGHSEEQWNYVKDNKDICGQFLWTGIDYLGEAHGWPIRTARSGIVTTAGYAKNYRFDLRKIYWTDEPVLEIYTSSKKDEYLKSWNFCSAKEVKIVVVTNLENPVLFINGKERNILKKTGNYIYTCHTMYETGEVEVKASHSDGKEHSDKITNHLDGRFVKTNTIESVDFERDIRLKQIEVTLTDENGNPVADDDTPLNVTVKGNGRLLGIENGNCTDLTPFYAPWRKTFNGRLIVYLKSKANEDVQAHISIGINAKDDSKLKQKSRFVAKIIKDVITK